MARPSDSTRPADPKSSRSNMFLSASRVPAKSESATMLSAAISPIPIFVPAITRSSRPAGSGSRLRVKWWRWAKA